MSIKGRITRLEACRAGAGAVRRLAEQGAAALASVRAKWAALMATNPPTVELDADGQAAALREIHDALHKRARGGRDM